MQKKELFKVEKLPVFQNKMFLTFDEARACPVGDVVLMQNHETGIVENSVFDPNLLEYDDSYQNEQGCSESFKKHLGKVRDIILKVMGDGSLIEVGCGKGYFLNMLRESGLSARGMDPAYEGNEPYIVKDVFKPGLNAAFDGVILRHVLEHISDPVSFLHNIAETNNFSGLIYIEVPCFDWILDNHAWFDIFYEHVNYFRISDFYRIFSSIYESGHVFGGQYMYVVADLSSMTPRSSLSVYEQILLPDDFMSELHDIAAYLTNREGKVVIWGAASKGVIFSIYMRRLGVDVHYLADINPAKQGMYIPAVGLLVSTPDEIAGISDVRDVVVMNTNYLDEIREMTGNKYQYITVEKDGI